MLKALILFNVILIHGILLIWLPPLDAMYMYSNIIGLVEWRSYGHMMHGIDIGGVSCLDGYGWTSSYHWTVATITTIVHCLLPS